MCLVILDPYYPIIGNGGLRYSDIPTQILLSFIPVVLCSDTDWICDRGRQGSKVGCLCAD